MNRLSLIVGCAACGLAVFAIAARRAESGAADALVRLQASTPGTQQIGHANVSGTLVAGAVSATSNAAITIRGVNPGTTTSSYGVFGSVAANGFGVNGQTNGSSGQGAGTYGLSINPAGGGVPGVWGDSLSTTNGWGVLGTVRNNGLGVVGLTESGIGVDGTALASTGNGFGVRGTTFNDQGTGVVGNGNSGTGVAGFSSNVTGTGVYGQASSSSGTTSAGVWGNNLASQGGYGVFGSVSNGDAIRGETTFGHGLYGLSTSPTASGTSGVYGLCRSNLGSGVEGHATALTGGVIGVFGESVSSSGYGVFGQSWAQGPNFGVGGYTTSDQGYAVYGNVDNGTGNAGVYGLSRAVNGNGVIGEANNGNAPFGVWGKSTSATGYAVFANGRTGATGTKSFRIDHPLDPYGKYLMHYSSEGPEPLNVYTGNVVTDAQGYAIVRLPNYFDEINKDPRYQLTIVDESDSPNFVQAKVVKKILNNSFVIRTSAPKIEVSWRVDAVRNDRFVQKYGAPTEVEKPEGEQGTLQQPELYGQPASKGAKYLPPTKATGARGHAWKP